MRPFWYPICFYSVWLFYLTIRSQGLPIIPKKRVHLVYSHSMESTESDSAPDISGAESTVEIEDLCSALAKLKPNISSLGYLCSPDCHRYEFRSIKDNRQASPNLNLISLDKLITGSKSTHLKLSRKQRFRLTTVLTSSLLQLQTTPWLTNNMSKTDIFFEYQGTEVIAEHPYICHYFPSNKPLLNNPSSTTPDPTATESHFTTRASLNQLGILLLELCFGEALEDQTEIREQYLFNGQPHNQTNILTAREWITDVECEAGIDFKNAIKNCFDFDVKPNWSDIKFTQSIHSGVLRPLENILQDMGWADESG